VGIHLNQQNQHTMHNGATQQKPIPQNNWQQAINTAKTIAILIAIAILLRTSVVEAYKIPSESMRPTLEVNDHILVNKLSYGLRLPFVQKSVWNYATPQRGEVVVFTRPDDPLTNDDEADTNIIKRVIGLPGDVIEVRGTQVLINGEIYTEDDNRTLWLDGGVNNFGPVTVPEGSVLLLGDNRDHSKDSRFWGKHPFLDIHFIKGRAFFIYFNTDFLWRRMFTVIR